jgi:hypothetical protein
MKKQEKSKEIPPRLSLKNPFLIKKSFRQKLSRIL